MIAPAWTARGTTFSLAPTAGGASRTGGTAVSSPRFMLAATSPTFGASGVTWRLVAGNNHGLGRAGCFYPDVDSAVVAVERLRRELDRALLGVVRQPEATGGWVWHLTLGDEELATSSRAHQRQRESRYSVQQFLAAVPVAQPPAALVLVRQRRVERRDIAVPATPVTI